MDAVLTGTFVEIIMRRWLSGCFSRYVNESAFHAGNTLANMSLLSILRFDLGPNDWFEVIDHTEDW